MKKLSIWIVLRLVIWYAESQSWWFSLLGSLAGGMQSLTSLEVIGTHWAMLTAITVIVLRQSMSWARLFRWGVAMALLWAAISLISLFMRAAGAMTHDTVLGLMAGQLVVSTLVTWWIFVRSTGRWGVSMQALTDDATTARFRSGFFEVTVDTVGQTVTVSGPGATWTDGRTAPDEKTALHGNGRARFTLPLDGFSFFQYELKESKTYANTASAMGTGTAFVEGQAVTVTAPVTVTTGYQSYTVGSGRYNVHFASRQTEWSVANPGVSRAADGTLRFSGYASSRTGRERALTVCFDKVPGDVVSKFESEFWPSLKKRIEAIEETAKSAALAASRVEQEAVFLQREATLKAAQDQADAAAQAQAAQALAVADAEVAELRERAGIAGEFGARAFDRQSGHLLWTIQVDRSGAALIAVGDDRWHGSLSGAKATIDTLANEPSVACLVVEVRDPDYEAAQLKRRRFSVLRGRARPELTDWLDRIEILAAK